MVALVLCRIGRTGCETALIMSLPPVSEVDEGPRLSRKRAPKQHHKRQGRQERGTNKHQPPGPLRAGVGGDRGALGLLKVVRKPLLFFHGRSGVLCSLEAEEVGNDV